MEENYENIIKCAEKEKLYYGVVDAFIMNLLT